MRLANSTWPGRLTAGGRAGAADRASLMRAASGVAASAQRLAARDPSGDEQDLARRLPPLQRALRLRGLGQRIRAVDADLELPGRGPAHDGRGARLEARAVR